MYRSWCILSRGVVTVSTNPPPGPGAPGGQFQSVYGGSAAAPQPQMAAPMAPQMAAPMAVPPRKKGLGPLAWVLIILGGLFIVFVICLVAAGMFLVHKAKQAGIDPDLMKRNPVMDAAKL